MGQMVTNQFHKFEMELQQSEWYSLESKLQKIYQIFLTISGEPTTAHGYGHIECLRVSLKKVIPHISIHLRCYDQSNKEIISFYF